MSSRTDANPAVKQLLAGIAVGNLRVKSGLRGMELADKAGILRSRYSQIENGRVVPTDEELRRIHLVIEQHDEEIESCVKTIVAAKAKLTDQQRERLAQVAGRGRR